MTEFFAFLGIMFVAIPFILCFAFLGTIWRSWWLYPAWGWYLVPLGVAPVNFWHFTALLFLVSTLTNHIDTKKDDRKFEWASLFVLFIWPIIVWALLRWMR